MSDWNSSTLKSVEDRCRDVFDQAINEFYMMRDRIRNISSTPCLYKRRINHRDGKGETPLFKAARKGDVEKCIDLIRHGADVQRQDNAGWTPLHEACQKGHKEVVYVFLAHNARTDCCSNYGDTPLHDAVKSQNPLIVAIVLLFTQDPCVRLNDGRSPLDVLADFDENEKDISLIRALLSKPPPPVDLMRGEGFNLSSAAMSTTLRTPPPSPFSIIPHRNQKSGVGKINAYAPFTGWSIGPAFGLNKPSTSYNYPHPPPIQYCCSYYSPGCNKFHTPTSVPCCSTLPFNFGRPLLNPNVVPTFASAVLCKPIVYSPQLTANMSSSNVPGQATGNRNQEGGHSAEDSIDAMDFNGNASADAPGGLDISDISRSTTPDDRHDIASTGGTPHLTIAEESCSGSTENPHSPQNPDAFSSNRTEDEADKPSCSRLAVWKSGERGESLSRAVSPHRASRYEFDEEVEEVRSESGYGKRRGGRFSRGRPKQLLGPANLAVEKKKIAAGRGRGKRRGPHGRPFDVVNDSGDDTYEFRGTPESDVVGETGEEPDDHKRFRGLDHEFEADHGTSGADIDGDDMDDDAESTRSSVGRKVPPLRISLTKNPSEEDPVETAAAAARNKPFARGRTGKKGVTDQDEAQRMTRSKVRQSGRGLDDIEGSGKKKKRPGAAPIETLIEHEEEVDEANVEAEKISDLPVTQTQPLTLSDVEKILYDPPGLARIKMKKMFEIRLKNDMEIDIRNRAAPEDLVLQNPPPFPPTVQQRPQDVAQRVLDNPALFRLWNSQEKERKLLEKEFDVERKRLVNQWQNNYRINERRKLGTTPRVSIMRLLRESDICNPQAVEEPFNQPAPSSTEEFSKKMQESVTKMLNYQRMRAEALYSIQSEDWFDEVRTDDDEPLCVVPKVIVPKSYEIPLI